MSELNTQQRDQIDHLVFAAHQLETGVEFVENLLGVPATVGGKHPDRGTHNALWRLGPLQYLEVIAPDPSSNLQAPPLWMGLKNLRSDGMMRWAAKFVNLPKVVAKARQANIPMGQPQAGQRLLSDGRLLKWQLTEPSETDGPDPLPFLIDWGSSPHPAENLADTSQLLDLQLFHPQAALLNQQFRTVGISIKVQSASTPSIAAFIHCPKG